MGWRVAGAVGRGGVGYMQGLMTGGRGVANAFSITITVALAAMVFREKSMCELFQIKLFSFRLTQIYLCIISIF